MKWWDLHEGEAVLEMSGPPGHELELLVLFGDGEEPTRAAWVHSQTGRLVVWVDAGEA